MLSLAHFFLKQSYTMNPMDITPYKILKINTGAEMYVITSELYV